MGSGFSFFASTFSAGLQCAGTFWAGRSFIFLGGTLPRSAVPDSANYEGNSGKYRIRLPTPRKSPGKIPEEEYPHFFGQYCRAPPPETQCSGAHVARERNEDTHHTHTGKGKPQILNILQLLFLCPCKVFGCARLSMKTTPQNIHGLLAVSSVHYYSKHLHCVTGMYVCVHV